MQEISSDRESIAGKVYESIRDAIVLGELVSGSLYSVHKLAAVLKVSRTPVREALIKLGDQGMVRFERNRGVRILQTTIHDLEEIFSLRLLLEVPATYRATGQFGTVELRQLRQALGELEALVRSAEASKASEAPNHIECDARFHRVILKASGNQRLTNFVDTLRDLQQVRGVSTVGVTREIRDVYQDHLDIFERIEARDPAGAATAMRDHIALTARLLLAQEAGAVGSAPRFDLSWLDIFAGFSTSVPQQPNAEYPPARVN